MRWAAAGLGCRARPLTAPPARPPPPQVPARVVWDALPLAQDRICITLDNQVIIREESVNMAVRGRYPLLRQRSQGQGLQRPCAARRAWS